MAIEFNHVTNQTHEDGVELVEKVAWCGEAINPLTWAFVDATHVLRYLFSGAGPIFPCRLCLAEIRDTIDTELMV